MRKTNKDLNQEVFFLIIIFSWDYIRHRYTQTVPTINVFSRIIYSFNFRQHLNRFFLFGYIGDSEEAS